MKGLFRGGAFVLAACASASAQNQPTFYAAFMDGQAAMERGDWRTARADFQRSVRLQPRSAARCVIYGNNLLQNYYPHSLILRCHLELGDLDSAKAALQDAQRYHEPETLWEPLSERLSHLLRAKTSEARASEPSRASSRAEAPMTVASPVAKVAAEPSRSAEVPAAKPAAALSAALQPMPRSSASDRAGTPMPGAPATPPATAPNAGLNPASKGTVPGDVGASTPEAAGPSGASASDSRPNALAQGGTRLGLMAGGAALVAGVLAWLLLSRRRNAKSNREIVDTFRDPEVIGPYQILRPLGRGGFAATFLARHRETGNEVALKVLLSHREEDEAYRSRFRQEARLGARLDHPCIVRILESGPDHGHLWIAMDYVPGQTLEALLKQSNPLPLPRVLDIAEMLASAMVHAHERGVVHRDLKPGNIVMTEDGLKVMDFGIARVMDAETMTTTYAFLGTPLYAAPEAQQISGVGPKADCYSFGVMLFEMLAGHPPFQGGTPFEILDKHRRETPPDLALLRPDLPAALVDLVNRLLVKEPDERPGGKEILAAIQGLR